MPDDPFAAVRRPRRLPARLGVGALVVLALAALAVSAVVGALSNRGTAEPLPVNDTAPVASAAPLTDTDPATAGGAVVHVAGAVQRPGLVDLPPGARVLDAVGAAGGFAAGADEAAVNLARPVVDGEQILVPLLGAAPADGAGASGAAADGSVRLNSATLADLDTLPGVGPAIAQRIIDHRDEHGPFTSVEQLTDVQGIGDATFEEIRDRVGL